MSKKLTVKQIKEKVEKLKAERGTWETHWQELADYILPRKNTITSQKFPGEKRSVNVLTSTGIKSNELLSGALHGMLTNPNAMWFELTTGDTEIDRSDNVRMWLQKTTKSMHNVLNNSNFQTEVHELYMDLSCFGTSPMYVEEDDRDIIRCSTRFIAEMYIDENHLGVVDQVFRQWDWDAHKIVSEFGIDKVGKKVSDAYKKGDTTRFCVIHAVYPRTMIDPVAKGAFKYISQYVLPDENLELREGGFREFPYVVPRWSKAAGEIYGRSPGMNALPEVKTLNKIMETTIMGAQKVVDPPLQLPDDGFIMPIITEPGGLNYYRSGTNDIIKPVFNDARIDFGFQVIQQHEKNIREAYYIDQLQLNTGPQMTATEVMQRTEEKMRLLGPMLGRMQAEFLRPLIDRVFEIMLRRGLINTAEIPAELQGRVLDVRYSSMIAKSQRLAEGQNMLRAMEALTPFANADRGVLDNLNGDQAFRVIAEVFGLPQEIIRKAKDVQQMRDARAQAQQQMIDAENAEREADSTPKVVGAMAQMQQMAQNQG
jgi:hypothetical protein